MLAAANQPNSDSVAGLIGSVSVINIVRAPVAAVLSKVDLRSAQDLFDMTALHKPNTQGSQRGFDGRLFLGIAHRRHLDFLVTLFLGWLIVWGLSWVLPARYESSTLILVEAPTMPKDYVVPNVNDDLQSRLQNITQQILSRTRLLHIVDELNLYSKDRGRLGPDQIVERMRKDIEIELVKDEKKDVTAFRIHYSAHDPSIAQQVTSKLTNLFINENLEVRQQESEGTTKFLGDQMDSSRQSLESQEEKIREFKAQHVGELPSQLTSNLQVLSGLQAQSETENAALNTAKQQRVYLETLQREYRTLGGRPEVHKLIRWTWHLLSRNSKN